MFTRSDLMIDGKRIVVRGSWLKTARLEDEWHDDIDDPRSFIEKMSKLGIKADLLSFWQRLPDTTPRFDLYREPDPIAVMPVTTYDNWLKKQINAKTRNLVMKSQKKGVVVQQTALDDEFIRGMSAI